MSLIKEVYDGKGPAPDAELNKLANTVASQSTGKNGTEAEKTSPTTTPAS